MQPTEVAVEAALLVMQNGGSTIAADQSFANILAAYHEEGVAAIWRLDFIATTKTLKGQPFTVVRPVGPIGVNLVRAAEVAVLSERVAKGELAVAALGAELERIKHLPAPYNRWFLVIAASFIAAAFSQISGGDWGSLSIALVAGSGGQFLRSLLQARKVSVVSVTLICGLLSATIASVALRLRFSQIAPATLMASVIYLAPGLPLINGFIDLASHKYLFVGIERIANAAFLFLILAVDIALASTVIG